MTLHEACKIGDIQKIHLLLIRGVNVNEKDSEGSSPLHVAANYRTYHNLNPKNTDNAIINDLMAKECCKSMVELLLSHGASLKVRNRKGQTPLHVIAQNGNTEIMRIIFMHDFNVKFKNKKRETSHIYRVKSGHLIPTEMLLKKEGNINATDLDNETPLHAAVRQGNYDVCKLLTDYNCKVNKINKWDQSPLDLALIYRDTAIVDLLLNNQADVTPTGDLQALILFATITNLPDQVNLILNQCNMLDLERIVNFRDRYGSSFLHLAVQYCDARIVQRLLEIGIDVNLLDGNNQTPLYKLVSFLHEDEGIDLEYSFRPKHLDIILILLHFYADLTMLPSSTSEPILDLLTNDHGPRVQEIILKYVSSMKVAGLAVKYNFRESLLDNEELKCFRLKCQLELKTMKHIIRDGLSLYQLLQAPVDKLTRYLKNPSIHDVLSKDFKKELPIYCHILDCHFKLALVRGSMRETCYLFFTSIINVQPFLPHICIEQIMCFLDNKDLQKLYYLTKDLLLTN